MHNTNSFITSNSQEETCMFASIKTLKERHKISVIIPVYNVESYLKECLDSIIHNTYKNLEIICIDDGSTDHSLDILELYSNKDSRIKVITQENKGPSSARNAGLENASGDYVSFVDADDFVQWNAYEILAEVASQKEKWDLIIFGGNVVGNENEYLQYKLNTDYKKYKSTDTDKLVFHEKSARPFLWLHLIKRSLLESPSKIRFDETMDLGEDQLFQFQYLPRAKNTIVIEDKLYNYRISNTSSIMQLYRHRRVQKTECHLESYKKRIYLS